ncbi:hypothetical protein WN51_11011 [Melipona quadrifasciata]|uniref:Uncharacterized protein n=1 Tax=Melipona quadrifasciata TaxID=166423 RepID=A0A0N1ITS6_9HYME|nr:hypothetical protein WN51_11011 [Melipona quadrifasciata]
MTNGLRRFPPLKDARSSAGGTTADISGNIFHREEIGSGSSKIVCDTSSSHPSRDSKMENNIVQAIYSVIENQLVSFNSLLNNFHPNFHRVLPNFHFNRLSSNETANEENGFDHHSDDRENKQPKFQNDDWILLPSSANARDTSGGSRVSVGEQCDNVRGVRHSIIVDEERRTCLLVGRRFRELSRNGLGRPFHTRRTLFVRSRLKDSEISGHKCPRPFTMFKRSKGNKTTGPGASGHSRTQHGSKSLKEGVVGSLNSMRSSEFLTMNDDESETITQQNGKRTDTKTIDEQSIRSRTIDD